MMGHMFRYGYPGYGGFDWWWIAGFAILRLLIFVGLVIFVVKLIKKGNVNKDSYGNTSRAIEILKERYAADEISEEEYKRKLKMLKD